ncbi:MAG: type II toxin-antitoxin system VapC family toxin [Candidatus Sumerlaeaceae bacterium]
MILVEPEGFHVLDSSAWIEYLVEGANAHLFLPPLRMKNKQQLIVPTIVIYEVCKKIMFEDGEAAAVKAIAAMQTATVVELSQKQATRAAALSLQHRLPMADSLIVATALDYDAILWTQDAHFAAFPNVKYFAKC